MRNPAKQAMVKWEVWRKLSTWNKVSSHRSEAAALESARYEQAHGCSKDQIEIRYVEIHKYSDYTEEK